jgi:RHS repeat-associated protein
VGRSVPFERSTCQLSNFPGNVSPSDTFTVAHGGFTQPAFNGDTGSIADCWAESFTYDPWGNLLSLGPNSTTQPNYVGCTQESGFNYTNAMGTNNRPTVSGFTYDAAGNLIASPGFTYGYDAENHLTSTAGVTYTYDGDGKRVMKSSGTIYWYGTDSDAYMETDLSNNMQFRYFFFNGARVARQDISNGVQWYFADHLGSSRVVWSTSGADISDYYPFGGERLVSTGANNHYKFTGKERDPESGLDNFGARYDSSSLGRFMSPDSTAYIKPINPQNWNLYAYALNNPLIYVDPTGHTVSLANCKDQNQCVSVLAKAGQLPDGVKATVDKKGNLKLEGDLSKIKGGNALRLLQLVNSDKTANFSIGDRSPLPGGGTQPVGGGASGTPSEGFALSFSVVQSDPSKVDSGDLSGVFLGKDGSISTGQIPGADEEETAAHELLGHVYAELIGGQPAIVNGQVNPGNLREALIAEDRVRNTDPSRGLKIRHQDSGQLIRSSDLPRITNPGSQP